MSITRRDSLKFAAAALGGALLPLPGWRALAQGGDGHKPRHGLSAFGDLKYPPGFKAFDYVRPDAPKGGRLSLVPSSWINNQAPDTFNTLNAFTFGGQAAVGMEMTFDSLMTYAEDEPDSYYGLVAESVVLSDNMKEAVFTLRPEARFHDGSPLTAADVVFSLDILKREGHPLIRSAILAMQEVGETEEGAVRVLIEGDFPASTLISVVAMPIFSKAYYEGREFGASTLEPPLASGPYRVKTLRQGVSITYERVKDYWGADLPVNAGQHNFDEIRYDFYRDRDTAFTAFTGGAYDLREEFTSRIWATRYNFPAVVNGRVKTETLSDESPAGGQAWHFNTRRAKFADPRVRQAIGMVFDFEWANQNLFYGIYDRAHSFFENSPMKAQGLPGEAELALLEPLRADIPPASFGEPYVPPVTDGSGRPRQMLRQAAQMLDGAGVKNVGGRRILPTGEPLEMEFLTADNGFLRIIEPYANNLQQLGIAARPRLVDPTQYQNRQNEFDFDIVTMRINLPLYPSPSLNSFFHSSSADQPGSRNLAGIRNPAVDQLVLHMLRAKDRESYLAAARALDRVLRASHYMVPQWFKASHHLAYWDRFSRPNTKPKYRRGIVNTWWYDADKAARL